MALLKKYGEMWARNPESIGSIPGSRKGGYGVYVLYNGSMPVYIGMGKIHRRIIKARDSKRRGKMWDHFNWYIPSRPTLTRDIETLLLRMLRYICGFSLVSVASLAEGKKSRDRKIEPRTSSARPSG